MISDREIWIYREVYSEIFKRFYSTKKLSPTFSEKIIQYALTHFYKDELSFNNYKALSQLDFMQRMKRIEKQHNRAVPVKFGDNEPVSVDSVLDPHKDLPDLRCPNRTEDKEDSHLFYHINTPHDLTPIFQGQVFIDWCVQKRKQSFQDQKA